MISNESPSIVSDCIKRCLSKSADKEILARISSTDKKTFEVSDSFISSPVNWSFPENHPIEMSSRKTSLPNNSLSFSSMYLFRKPGAVRRTIAKSPKTSPAIIDKVRDNLFIVPKYDNCVESVRKKSRFLHPTAHTGILHDANLGRKSAVHLVLGLIPGRKFL